MTREQIMATQSKCRLILADPNSNECERIAAELALKHLPQVSEGFAALSQPREVEYD